MRSIIPARKFTSPLPSLACSVLIDKASFRRHAAGKSHEVWQGLHASLGLRPPKGPSCARIIAGLHALVQCLSHTFS